MNNMIYFFELYYEPYKSALLQATAEMMQNPAFELKKPVNLADNYFQGKPLPELVVRGVNEVLQDNGFTPTLDYDTMSFMISDMMYEGWMHKDEEWKDYFVVHECTINGQPYIFKYTHPTLKELRAFQSDWVKDCKTLIRLNADEETGFYLIENVIARYYLGGVFDLCFNGDADNLPLRMERTFNGEAYDIYYELMDSMGK